MENERYPDNDDNGDDDDNVRKWLCELGVFVTSQHL